VHDVALEYRSHAGILMTYTTASSINHNEVYNLPYSAIATGYGWGANDAGGSQDYTDRGLYNYQPRYTTATIMSNNQVVGNYVHDVVQQMTDGGGFYHLSASPGSVVNQNYFRNTNGWLRLYFDEGSRYVSAANNVFDNTGTWAYTQEWANNNTGNLTLTNNWTTNNGSNVKTGTRGNTNSGTVVVSGGNWPTAARNVMNAAGLEAAYQYLKTGGTRPSGPVSSSPVTSSPPPVGSTGVLRGVQSNRCLDVPGNSQTDGTQLSIWDCNGGNNQKWTQTTSNQLTVYGSKCLDVPNHATTSGTRVQISTCSGGANQQWRLNSDGTGVGIESGLCLDVSGLGTANGTAVQIWTCNGGNNQKWTRS